MVLWNDIVSAYSLERGNVGNTEFGLVDDAKRKWSYEHGDVGWQIASLDGSTALGDCCRVGSGPELDA